MEVGQGPNWGCSAKGEKKDQECKKRFNYALNFVRILDRRFKHKIRTPVKYFHT
jgi:hypothetical protein